MSLDTKLENMLIDSKGGGTRIQMSNDSIKRIKQAFADEGYINWQTLPKGVYNHTGKSFGQISANDVMTGQEWFSRFDKEVHKFPNHSDILVNEAEFMRAAKRAAGIK